MVSSFLNNFLDIALFELGFQVKLYHEYVGYKAKGQILKRFFQENKVRQIIRKTNISYPLIRTRTCACQGLRNVRFSEKLACFVFFKNQFRDSPFCLITANMPRRLVSLEAPTGNKSQEQCNIHV